MMSDELKLALQALGAISEKDTRMGSLKEVFRLFQKVQRMVFNCDELSCNVDSRSGGVRISMYFYPNLFSDAQADYLYYYIVYSSASSYELKKEFFRKLQLFIKNIKNYYYEHEQSDPTRTSILP